MYVTPHLDSTKTLCYFQDAGKKKVAESLDNSFLVMDSAPIRLGTQVKLDSANLFYWFCSPSRLVTGVRPKTARMGRTKPLWNKVTGACAGVAICI